MGCWSNHGYERGVERRCVCPLGKGKVDPRRGIDKSWPSASTFRQIGSCRAPRKSRARQSSYHAMCCTTSRQLHWYGHLRSTRKTNAPDDPTMVELDVEDVAHVAAAVLAHELPRVQIPHLDRFVVAPAHEPPAAGVEGKCAD